MNQIEISIMSFLDLVGYFIISSKLVKDSIALYGRKKLIKIAILMIAFSYIMGVAGVTSFTKYSFILGIIVSNVFIHFLYKRKINETIFIYIITTVILLIIQILVIAILVGLKVKGTLDFDFTSGILAQCLIIPILILVNKYIPLDLLLNFINKKNRVFVILILNMFIILISFLIYRYIEMQGLLKDIVIIAILATGLIFINLVIVKDGLRNEYEEKMLVTYEKYLPIIDELMNELRSKQHEFDNHIQAINMITVTSSDYESIVNSMKRYIKDLDIDSDFRKLIKLDNKVLAGFLYNKTIKAKEYNIDFQIDIKDYGFKTNLKDYELIEVLGNLIDNAFETGVENNCVKLELKTEKNMSVIEIKNKHPYLDNNTLSKFFTSGYSTKSTKNRGHGLPNLNKILKTNNGLISVQNQTIDGQNYVVFRVLFVRV